MKERVRKRERERERENKSVRPDSDSFIHSFYRNINQNQRKYDDNILLVIRLVG